MGQKLRNHNQKRKGFFLSYINIALNMFINLFLIPLLINSLSDLDYSLYKVMQAYAGPLIMFDLGLSTIVARVTAKYQIDPDGTKKEKENTFAIAIILSLAMIVFIIGFLMAWKIPDFYGGNYDERHILMARQMFWIFLGSTAMHIAADTFKGCVIGNERFVFLYGVQTLQYALRFILIFLCSIWGRSAVIVASVDLLIGVVTLFLHVGFVFFVLKEKPRLHYVDREELLSIASFSMAILLQAFINQVNSHVDIMILGAKVSDKAIITMYSSALSIYSVYNSLLYGFLDCH